jgi:hypothetical protein
MKLAWLCYDNDENYPQVIIVFSEPSRWRYSKVVPIVYAEIEE